MIANHRQDSAEYINDKFRQYRGIHSTVTRADDAETRATLAATRE